MCIYQKHMNLYPKDQTESLFLVFILAMLNLMNLVHQRPDLVMAILSCRQLVCCQDVTDLNGSGQMSCIFLCFQIILLLEQIIELRLVNLTRCQQKGIKLGMKITFLLVKSFHGIMTIMHDFLDCIFLLRSQVCPFQERKESVSRTGSARRPHWSGTRSGMSLSNSQGANSKSSNQK